MQPPSQKPDFSSLGRAESGFPSPKARSRQSLCRRHRKTRKMSKVTRESKVFLKPSGHFTGFLGTPSHFGIIPRCCSSVRTDLKTLFQLSFTSTNAVKPYISPLFTSSRFPLVTSQRLVRAPPATAWAGSLQRMRCRKQTVPSC